jgi:signal transduction histidine kinase
MIAKLVIALCALLVLSCSSRQLKHPAQNSLDVIDTLISSGNYEEAVPAIKLMINQASDEGVKAELLYCFGLCMDNMYQSDSCIVYYNLAADIFSAIKDSVRLARVLLPLGTVYSNRGNHSEALRVFSEGLRWLNKKSDSNYFHATICFDYINQFKYDSAYFIIKKYLLGYENKMPIEYSYYVYLGQGLYWNSQKKYDTALSYLAKALPKAFNDIYKANVYTNIATVYKSNGDITTSFHYLDSAKSFYEEKGWDENKLFDYDLYRELYDSLGKYDSAYYYSQLYRELADSMYKAKNDLLTIDAAVYAKTTTERAKREQAEVENKLKTRSLIFSFIGLGLVALLAFVAFRNVRIKQKANQLLTQQKQQVQQLADQLAIANDTKARLFSTIGHDLRSPVSSLYASLKMQELKGNNSGGEMSEQTVRLLDTLEELLIWSKSQMDGFKVQPVKLNVKYFFEDLKEFYSHSADAKNIKIVNNTAKEMVIRTDENLLKTIFRNAISNAIANTPHNQTIHLGAAFIDDNNVCISVANPCMKSEFQKFKTSFDDAVVKSGAYGLGIVLMKEFAEKLHGKLELSYAKDHATLNLCMQTSLS